MAPFERVVTCELARGRNVFARAAGQMTTKQSITGTS